MAQERKNKITIFIPEIVAFGGEERAILAISRYLNARGISHQVVCYYDHIDLSSYATWPLEIVRLDPKRNGLMKAWALNRFLKGRPAGEKNLALLIGLQSAYHVAAFSAVGYFLRISDTPSLVSEPPPSTNMLTRPFSWLRGVLIHGLTRRGFQNASNVIATTQYLADEIREFYGVDPLILHIGGKRTENPYKYRPLRNGDLVHLLTVSRVEANKRIDWILRSLKELEHQAWELDVVGTGSKVGEYKALAKTLGIGDRVRFHEFVTDERLEKLYEQAHVFVMPARQGFGVPALEALDRKIPVVIHRDSGVSEILGGTPWAELFDGGPENLTAAIERMLSLVQAKNLADIPLPVIPTEDQWAEAVCRLGGWIS